MQYFLIAQSNIPGIAIRMLLEYCMFASQRICWSGLNNVIVLCLYTLITSMYLQVTVQFCVNRYVAFRKRMSSKGWFAHLPWARCFGQFSFCVDCTPLFGSFDCYLMIIFTFKLVYICMYFFCTGFALVT